MDAMTSYGMAKKALRQLIDEIEMNEAELGSGFTGSLSRHLQSADEEVATGIMDASIGLLAEFTGIDYLTVLHSLGKGR